MLRLGTALGILASALGASVFASRADAAETRPQAQELLNSARAHYQNGQYFKSARYAFAAAQENGGAAHEAEAYSWVTVGLTQAGLPQASSYFFIRTLQSQDRAA